MTDPSPAELFPEDSPDKTNDLKADLSEIASRIAAAAGDQGIRAAAADEARRDESVQADLGGQKSHDASEPTWRIPEETRAIGRQGVAEARAVLHKDDIHKAHIKEARAALRKPSPPSEEAA